MLRATAHRVFLNRRIRDTLAALTFGPRRRSDDAVTQANKVSWSWHKCRRPTATSVAPYAVVTVSGESLFRNENNAALFRADSSDLRPWTGYEARAWGLPHCTTMLEFVGVLDLLVVMHVQQTWSFQANYSSGQSSFPAKMLHMKKSQMRKIR